MDQAAGCRPAIAGRRPLNHPVRALPWDKAREDWHRVGLPVGCPPVMADHHRNPACLREDWRRVPPWAGCLLAIVGHHRCLLIRSVAPLREPRPRLRPGDRRPQLSQREPFARTWEIIGSTMARDTSAGRVRRPTPPIRARKVPNRRRGHHRHPRLEPIPRPAPRIRRPLRAPSRRTAPRCPPAQPPGRPRWPAATRKRRSPIRTRERVPCRPNSNGIGCRLVSKQR